MTTRNFGSHSAFAAGALIGGVPLAAIPAVVLASSSRLFAIEQQGILSVIIMFGVYAGQLAYSYVVESRLSSPNTLRQVAAPWWSIFLPFLATFLAIFFGLNFIALCFALPMILIASEVGRGVSISQKYDRREIGAALLVSFGTLLTFICGLQASEFTFVPLFSSVALAMVVRTWKVTTTASVIEPGVLKWVLTDTSITGLVYPALNLFILTSLGPEDAFVFAAVATVSGLLGIPLTFMRMRLLKEHSYSDIAISALALVAAFIAICIAEISGVLGIFFGSAWEQNTTLLPLILACIWRASSLASTIPFASLRRAGHVRLLTGLRGAGSLLTFSLAACGLLIGDLLWVFIGLTLAELLTAVIFARSNKIQLRRKSSPVNPIILVDLLFFTGHRGGMETLVRKVYERIEHSLPGVTFIGLASRELYEAGAKWFPGELINSKISTGNAVKWAIAEQLIVPRVARSVGADLIHSPANISPLLGKTPVVLSLHDMLAFDHPEYVPGLNSRILKSLIQRSATKSVRIITLSVFSQKSIHKHLGIDESKITICYLAGSTPHSKLHKIFSQKQPENKLILTGGNRLPHKNFETLIKAIGLIPENQRPRLVVTGGGANDPLTHLIKCLHLEPWVEVTDWIPHEAVEQLYMEATLYVFPTRYEGFGLPVLEAMSRGCPVLCSDISVLREVGGTSCEYVDSTSATQIARGIEELLSSPKELARLRKLGLKRASEFSWDLTAETTADVFKSVLESSRKLI